MKRWIVLLYGTTSYVISLGVMAYTAGFIGGFLVSTRLDGPADSHPLEALVVNSLLIAVFGLQHSVMARPGFKRWWTKLIPAPMERSTYMLATNVALVLMFWQWRPMGGVIWEIHSAIGQAAGWSLFALGWLTVLYTTFLINHFDLFGLRHVWLYFRGREYAPLPFVTPGPYSYVRHPLYIGWLLAFWATPTMTAAHLVFALGMTAYILIAIFFEERDLVEFHEGYAEYRRRVPMFVPRFCNRFQRRESTMETGATLSVPMKPVAAPPETQLVQS
jgi:methanethiol S-methyltransferase